MDTLYRYAERVKELYELLEDELSKKIFLARIQFDITYSVEDALRLFGLTGILTEEEAAIQLSCRKTLNQIKKENKKVILYGAGGGGLIISDLFIHNGIDFYSFCDKDETKQGQMMQGKKVLSPNYLFEHADDCYVIISTIDYIAEVFQFLTDNHFPKDHILPFFRNAKFDFSKSQYQYFEFPDFYPKGKAFIDGGCFDCKTSAEFVNTFRGDYTKIIAFEPDVENFQKCKIAVERLGIERIELVQAGLSDTTGTAVFAASSNTGSHISDEEANKQSMVGRFDNENFQAIQTIALDDKVGNCPIGFIKLDIEGAELSALQGAKKTILRDKPFLAICVYHRRGDVCAIMDYLHMLIPEYHFWLRHYAFSNETVLYASI